MLCDAVGSMIRPFLDDLLDEKDYQDVSAHIQGCQRCRVYASSVGTLSYRIYELGQVPLPPDMVSTILYEYKKLESQTSQEDVSLKVRGGGFFIPLNRFFWISLTTLFVLSVVVTAAIIGFRKVRNQNKTGVSTFLQRSGTDSAPISPDRKIQTQLEKIKTIVYAAEESIPAEQKLNEIREVVGGLADKEDLLAQWRPTHWHYHLSVSSQPELIELIRQMQLQIDNESANFFVFYVSKTKLDDFRNRMSGLSGVVKEYGDLDSSHIADDSIQVSVYLE